MRRTLRLDAKEELESYGLTATHNATTQRWEINFGVDLTQEMVAQGNIKFYIAISDAHGNKWGSIDDPTTENTFEFEFISYENFALMEVKAASTYEAMRDVLLKYKDDLNIEEDIWDLFNDLPQDQDRQQAIIGAMILLRGL